MMNNIVSKTDQTLRPTPRERVAKVRREVESAVKEHGVIAVYEAWLRKDNDEYQTLLAFGIEKFFIGDAEPFHKLSEQLPEEYKARQAIVFYINENTLETRHRFQSFKEDAFGFNDDFTKEDSKAGWRAKSSSNSFFYPPQKIEEEHKKNVAFEKMIAEEYVKQSLVKEASQ